jgi:aminomethyltransferase
LDRNIGLCYLPIEYAKPGEKIEVVVRNQPVEAVTVATPFYRRST